MARDVVTVAPDATLVELCRLLRRHRIGGVPVVDDRGDVRGVVSATDVVRFAGEPAGGRAPGRGAAGCRGPRRARRGYYRAPDGPPWFPNMLDDAADLPALEHRAVEDVMTPVRYAVRPGTSVARLARLMLRHRIHRALVLDGDRLAGIVTAFDVLTLVGGEVDDDNGRERTE